MNITGWHRFLLNEELGAQWTVYHSFGNAQVGSELSRVEGNKDIADAASSKEHAEELVKKRIKGILKNGFTPGHGATYGKGIYAVADFADLSTAYGPYTLRFRVNLSGFLIFDSKVAKVVYGRYYKLKDQLKLLNFDPKNKKINEIINKLDNQEYYGGWTEITSLYAGEFSALIATKYPEYKNHFSGLVFRGSTDGLVVVGYDLNKFKLTGWSMLEKEYGNEFNNFINNNEFKLNELKPIAQKNDISVIDLKEFLRSIFLYTDRDKRNKILGSGDLKNNFPHVYEQISRYYRSGDTLLRDKIVEDGLTPEEKNFYYNILQDDEFPFDLPEDKQKIYYSIDEKIEKLTKEYNHSLFQKLMMIVNKEDFSFLNLSSKRIIKTKFNQEIDGIPLREWW